MDLHHLLDIAPYSWESILACLFCGSLLGLERQLRGKPVGIRTASLIIIGTYLFLASSFLLHGDSVDPSRVVGQVVTGIGFLGAGVMLARDGIVVGVTSAASIWVLAALGVVIATGHTAVAMRMAVLVVVILYGVDLLEDNFKVFSRGVHTTIRTRILRRSSDDERDGPAV